MAMTDINAGPLHITSQVMRDMMRVNSIVEENLDNLLAAIKRQHDSEVQTWQDITGGLALVVYAGGCNFFPALPIHTWVTGGFATSAVVVGGAAGAALTWCEGERLWVEEVKKAKERRDKVTDDFNNLKRVLNLYFAIVAIRYYEEVLHISFQKLNDIEKRQCRIEFGLDDDLVHKKEYTDAIIEKGAEELEFAEDKFKKSFEVLLKDEGLSSIKRSYV
ncbi:uncharacterized protein BDV14DRAFT_205994 [Aspergillus stella-maris]|uniref:uncharacterized protein n=1 Tax=Aspergillus stella-maris TaxID=1810926 RepID=UPI003CCE0915